MLDVVERTHPRIVSPSGQRRASDRYQCALVFECLPYAPDNFDLAVSSNLAAYAQPCISGETKRLPRPRRPRQRRAGRPPAARDVPRGRVGRRAVRQLPGSATELRTAVAPGDSGQRDTPQEVEFKASRTASRALSATATKGPTSMLATGVFGVDGWGRVGATLLAAS